MIDSTMVRRSWADVTLGQYAALSLLDRPDSLFVDVLSPKGLEWLSGVRARVAAADDELIVQEAAREVLRVLGVLTVYRLARTV